MQHDSTDPFTLHLWPLGLWETKSLLLQVDRFVVLYHGSHGKMHTFGEDVEGGGCAVGTQLTVPLWGRFGHQDSHCLDVCQTGRWCFICGP